MPPSSHDDLDEPHRLALQLTLQLHAKAADFFSNFYCRLVTGEVLIFLAGLGALAFAPREKSLDAIISRSPWGMFFLVLGFIALSAFSVWGHYYLNEQAEKYAKVARHLLKQSGAKDWVDQIPRHNSMTALYVSVFIYAAKITILLLLLIAILFIRRGL